jgi:hypothetical protein
MGQNLIPQRMTHEKNISQSLLDFGSDALIAVGSPIHCTGG